MEKGKKNDNETIVLWLYKKMFMLRENLKITFLLHSQDYQARAETHY